MRPTAPAPAATATVRAAHCFIPLDGLGASEDRLGAALAAAGPAAATAKVTTKIGRLIRGPDGEPCAPDFEAPGSVPLEERKIVNDFTAAGVRTSLSESLGRLGVEKVHTLRKPAATRWLASGLHSPKSPSNIVADRHTRRER